MATAPSTLATRLRQIRHWVFDMDGTLTVAVHDFDAIRSALGLPAGTPILEAIEAMPAAERAPMYRRLDDLELDFARMARAQAGVAELLGRLLASGARLGVLTRNSDALARETLARAGLAQFFDDACVLGRESAPAKPAPDGIHKLLHGWGAEPGDAAMVGDFVYDLQAGRRAGTLTVYFDADDSDRWSADADLRITHHGELLALIT